MFTVFLSFFSPPKRSIPWVLQGIGGVGSDGAEMGFTCDGPWAVCPSLAGMWQAVASDPIFRPCAELVPLPCQARRRTRRPYFLGPHESRKPSFVSHWIITIKGVLIPSLLSNSRFLPALTVCRVTPLRALHHQGQASAVLLSQPPLFGMSFWVPNHYSCLLPKSSSGTSHLRPDCLNATKQYRETIHFAVAYNRGNSHKIVFLWYCPLLLCGAPAPLQGFSQRVPRVPWQWLFHELPIVFLFCCSSGWGFQVAANLQTDR